MTDIRDVTTARLLKRLRAWEECEGPARIAAGKEKVIAELRAELERRGELPSDERGEDR